MACTLAHLVGRGTGNVPDPHGVVCGAGDDTLDDRDPGEAPVPQGWTKLCDDDPIESTAPCDLDEISYRNDRTDDEVEEKEKYALSISILNFLKYVSDNGKL